MKSIIGTDELKRQIFLNQDKTIIITGDAGTGKTVTVIEAAEAMGVTPLLFRMQGIESTDITGINW